MSPADWRRLEGKGDRGRISGRRGMVCGSTVPLPPGMDGRCSDPILVKKAGGWRKKGSPAREGKIHSWAGG